MWELYSTLIGFRLSEMKQVLLYLVVISSPFTIQTNLAGKTY